MRWRAAVRAALTLRRTSSGRRDSRGSSWFESTWTAAKLRSRLVGVARRGCRTMRQAFFSSGSADDGRRGVLPAIGGWVSGHLAGFAGRPVPVCESAWADSLEMLEKKFRWRRNAQWACHSSVYKTVGRGRADLGCQSYRLISGKEYARRRNNRRSK